MQSHYYAFLSRMKNIYRWGLMRNMKAESLSEHSFEVALIAHCLAVINNVRLGGNVDANACAAAALFHDTSEIITGDMPTPIKYYNEEIKTEYKKIEKKAEESLMLMLPEDMRDTFSGLYRPDEDIRRLVKAADRISALIKCTEELNMGNREFAEAEKSIRESISKLGLKEVEIFMDEFMDSFSLSLDEQK